MDHLLHISASPRGAASHSRRVGTALVERLRQRKPFAVVEHDLARQPFEFPGQSFADASLSREPERTPEQIEALRVSERLIAELEFARVLVIDTPMHNFALPATLKCWIDYVVRPGRTFHSSPTGKVGLLEDRPVYLVVSCGGPVSGNGRGQMDFLTPYLRYVLATIGLCDLSVLVMDCMLRGPETVRQRERAAAGWIAAQVREFAKRSAPVLVRDHAIVDCTSLADSEARRNEAEVPENCSLGAQGRDAAIRGEQRK